MRLISCFSFTDDFCVNELFPLLNSKMQDISCKTSLTTPIYMSIIKFNQKIVTRINPRYGGMFLPEANVTSAYE